MNTDARISYITRKETFEYQMVLLHHDHPSPFAP